MPVPEGIITTSTIWTQPVEGPKVEEVVEDSTKKETEETDD